MKSYPFSPAVLDALPEELAELFRALEISLLEEICSRLKAAGELNEVTVQDIRALRSHGIDLKDIEKAIRKTTGISEKKLKELLDDVVERNQKYYTDLIDLAHITQPETLVSIEDTWAIYEQTKQTMRNLTRSMGFLVDAGRTMLPPARAYQWALDNATMQIQSDAISYNQAIKSAVQQLAKSGLKVVDYESGHRDQIDVAARRAVMSGVNALNQKYAEQSTDYLETDLVETSAHIGARNTGVGPMNHGAVFKLIDVTIIRGINAAKHINGICKTGMPTGRR
jgi:DNA-binding transcriptional MerR regulator